MWLGVLMAVKIQQQKLSCEGSTQNEICIRKTSQISYLPIVVSTLSHALSRRFYVQKCRFYSYFGFKLIP